MANIPPRVRVQGMVHRLDRRVIPGGDNYASRNIDEALILTDGGGFLTVVVPDDLVAKFPRHGEVVDLVVDYAIRTYKRRDGEFGASEQVTLIRDDSPKLAAVGAAKTG